MSDFEQACLSEGWELHSSGDIVYKDTGKSVDWEKADPLAAMAVLLSGKGPSRKIEEALWKGMNS